jgi:ABC-type multidrug transport system ATPase subunit
MAQVMIGNPDFMILDEPFNGLDPDVRAQMLAFMVTLKEQGKGILVSTHQLEDIELIADDFIMLHKGKVFLSGKMDEYRADRQNVTLSFSGPLPVGFDAGPGLTVTKNTIYGMADIKESEDLLKKLYAAGLIPYQVSRSGILHDKYMEMTR